MDIISYSKVSKIGVELEKVKSATVITTGGVPVETDITSSMVYSDGYVNKAGTEYSSDTTYAHTQKLPVREGDVFKVTDQYSTYRFVCAYNGDAAVEAKGDANVTSYTVPSGVTDIIITIYADVRTRTSGIIVKVSSEINYQNSASQEIEKVRNATVTATPSGTPTETDITTQMQYSNGYMNKAGSVDSSATTYRYTQKIPVNEGEKYKVTASYSSYRFICAFNGNTVVEEKGAANVTEYTVPAGVTDIVITIYADIVDRTSQVVVKVTTEYIYENSANALVEAEETARETADNVISGKVDGIISAVINDSVVEKQIDVTADQTWYTGQYVNQEGYNGSSSSYNRTAKIAVNEGDKFINSGYANWRFVCAYNGDTVESTKGASSVTEYTVPAGVTHIIFTLYSDESMSIKTIIKVENVHIMENTANGIKPHNVKRAARVTFIDDDGYAEFYTYFVPIMQEYGVPMCSAYMGDVCPTFKNSTYMTEEQCRTVEQLGGEIIVHGGTSLTDFATLEQAEANVIASQSALAAHGFKSDVYVYPGGANDVAIREMMERHFKCAFKTGYPQKGDNRVNDKCVPHYFIHRSSAGGYFDDKSSAYGNYDTYTLDYFKALIDDAIARKGWLVFMTHAWMMPIGCSYRLQHDAGNGVPADLDEFDQIRDIIEYILTKKNNGDDIEIVTASEGFEMFKNDLQSGDYLGWWNETYSGISKFEHNKAGFAVNKLGDIDFADSNRISHT